MYQPRFWGTLDWLAYVPHEVIGDYHSVLCKIYLDIDASVKGLCYILYRAFLEISLLENT